MGRTRHALVALALAGTLVACSQDQSQPSDDPSPASPSGEPSDLDPSDQPGSPDSSTGEAGQQGSPGSPLPLEATTDLLEWRDVPGPTSTTVTVSGAWTLTQHDREAVLEGPRSVTVEAPARHRVTDTLIDGEYAVVVTADELEEQANTATVIDLATGDRSVLDGSSDVPTTSGGTWALGQGQLVHATIGRGRAYCAATVELADLAARTTWCAPPRQGFNGARITPEGTTVLTFDDGRPSCRTVGRIDSGELAPLEGVPDCTAWDSALVDGGAVWSVVPSEKRIEEADFYAREGDSWFDLGPGTSGTLTWCGGAAYFARDPQRTGDPARLMRWAPGDGLSVVFETAGGEAFLTAPRCGGDTLTVTALAESGDVQVAAGVR